MPLLVVAWVIALGNIGFGLMPTLPLELSSLAADILVAHAE